MNKLALFIKVKAQPGKREQVWQLWKELVKPHVEESDRLEVNCYCYDADNPDTICLFEIFSDVSDFETANRSEWFAKYQERVKPFIAAPTEVVFAKPIWAKGVTL